MATSPQPVPQGAPTTGAPAGNSGQVLQLIQIITKASDALGKVFPPGAPMVSAIQNQVQQIQSKISETQRPTQPQAPPI